MAGLAFAICAAAVLMLRVASGGENKLAVLIYALCLVASILGSAAYNLAGSDSRLRPFLRRLDHAAIFVMIAGTYTPFADRAGAAITAAVWGAALVGASVKLIAQGGFERGWVVVYLAFGWAVLAAFRPIIGGLDPATIYLLVAGGLLYSFGTGFYLCRTLPFHNAIWHAFVLAAAGCHYAAVTHAMF